MAAREQLIIAIRTRLELAAAAQDPSPLLEPDALREARHLTAMLGDDDADLPTRNLLGWLHWNRYQALPQGQDEADLDAATAMFGPCFTAGFGELPTALQPVLAGRTVPMALALLRRASGSADPDLMSASVDLWQRILEATSDDHPDLAGRLSNLGIARQARFERTADLADLEAAVQLGQAAVDGTHAGHPDRAAMLSNLGDALQARFGRIGNLADLDAAIRAGQAAVDAAAADHPGRAVMLSNLGNALQSRYRRTQQVADLDAAIQAGQAAADTTPPGHPYRAAMLSNLGNGLLARYRRSGVLADLDAAIVAAHTAVEATLPEHPDRARYLSNLGSALLTRFGRTGMPTDLDAAVEAARAAVEATPPGHPDQAGRLSTLGSTLRTRFGRTGVLADLDAAVEAAHAAVEATPPGHPDRAGRLSSLGMALRTRFERTGDMTDVDAAIQAGHAAVEAIPSGHADTAAMLSNLGNALRARFGRTGVLADLDTSIKAGQAAVEATPPDHPNRARYLSNLGDALRTRFGRTGVPADLDAAVEAGLAAVDAIPSGHADRAAMLSNLGNALRTRFGNTGVPADLDASIKAGQAAIEATARDHPDRARYLSNLGNALRARFGRTGVSADLDSSIKAGQAAVKAAPPDHPGRAEMLSSLGTALQASFERTGVLGDRDAAKAAFAAAAELASAAPSTRIRAARAAAALAAESEPGWAADLLETAVRLLPEVTPRQLARGDQQYAIGGFAGLAGDAAALALADRQNGAASGERAVRALSLIEAGRAVLLSQALDTRSDLTELRRKYPELAAQFTALRDRLDQPEDTTQPTAPVDPNSVQPIRADDGRQRLAGQLTATLVAIRALEGFASFGLPPNPAELLAEAASGPVVTFTVSAYGSHALLLTEDGTTSLELPGLTYDTLISRINDFYRALHAATDLGVSMLDRIAAQKELLEILGWLWDTAAGPVLDTLGYRQPPPPGAVWPRLWWAPGGLLGLLPVHAAGHHAESLAGDRARRTVMDRVVSSWTPTIRALRYARRHPSALPTGRALIVAMPVTPGLPDGGELPNVPAEVERVHALLPDAIVLAGPGITSDGFPHGTGITGVPTRASVFEHLPGCPIAHFACHGFSNPEDPSNSLLLLQDHDSTPLTVASLAPVNLDRAQLAYLSACDTAFTSAAGLIDEAIHLTTAFQLAGFPHVIGTLWQIDDGLAISVADAFYTTLRTSTGTVDTSRAAFAVHHAVLATRASLPATPSLWAAYLHAGA